MTSAPTAVFFHRETLEGSAGPVELGFTDRTLDLHLERPGFDTELGRLEAACGVRLAVAEQVHGRDVVVVGEQGGAPPRADALIATGRGVGLVTRVADCVPVLLVAPEAGVVAAVHSGRPGTVLDVVTATVDRMRTLGAGDDLAAWVGPSVCAGCYEVPEELRAEVDAAVPGTGAETTWGTPSVDVTGGVQRQLAAAGVPARVVEGCTVEDERLHSYRRDGADAGRAAGVVWLP